MRSICKSKNSTENLDMLISKIRHLLNELCINPSEISNSKEVLILSRCLDDLIVESIKINQLKKDII